MGSIFFISFIQLVLLKNKSPIHAGMLGFSVLILGFDLSVYLPWCALFSEAHTYQVCAGEYLTEVFGNDYMYDEDFLKEKDYYSLGAASTLITTAKIYVVILLLVFI
jgi:hypothetical protein